MTRVNQWGSAPPHSRNAQRARVARDAKPPRYYLSAQAHLCVRQDGVVLLDLTTGKYFALDIAEARRIGAWIRGWPVQCDDAAESEILEAFVEIGLVTEDQVLGKTAAPITIMWPTKSLQDRVPWPSPRIRLHHILRFLLAALAASFAARIMPIGSTARRVTARRKNSSRNYLHASPERIAELVFIFNRLWPIIFRRVDACFIHSLALTEFLAGYRIFPQWIFAVRTGPFFAHCWLQEGEVVLNDSHLTLVGLTPIMVL